jgi:ubiquinone/menaquinone biosynthesis C-methylase UbiE
MEDQELKNAVREGYAKVAKQAGSCCSSSCCGTAKPKEIGKKIGYTEREMQAVPSGSNLGLGCGNPTALASIKENETVLDLGSGAGFDCFLASNLVGPKGRVIGVDMTAEMVQRARDNALKGGYKNVEFRLGEIEALPVEDNTIDIIISNCVINLVPNKEKAFSEAFRVLKAGGRLMVSDIVLLKKLPDFVKESIEAYVGCVAGASMKDRYLDAIKSAGFEDVAVIEESIFPLDCMTNDPTGQAILKSLKGSAEDIKKVEASIASIKVQPSSRDS